jgi:thioredoxin-like negative regulator of GroEL
VVTEPIRESVVSEITTYIPGRGMNPDEVHAMDIKNLLATIPERKHEASRQKLGTRLNEASELSQQHDFERLVRKLATNKAYLETADKFS